MDKRKIQRRGDPDSAGLRRFLMKKCCQFYFAPAIIKVFLQSYDFSGKTIIPLLRQRKRERNRMAV